MRRQKLIFVNAVALCGVGVLALWSNVNDKVQHNREIRKIHVLWGSFKAHAPDGVSDDAWNEAWGWTQTAIVNVCGFTERTELVTEFRKGLEHRSSQPNTVATFDWIWDQLEIIAADMPTRIEYVNGMRINAERALESSQGLE